MTREKKMAIFSMRLDGISIDKIAETIGLNPGEVATVLRSVAGQHTHSTSIANSCVYPALREYILENRIDRCGFYRMLYKIPQNQSLPCSYYNVISGRLSGKVALSSAEWLRLAEVTGISLEKLMDSCGAIPMEPKRRNPNENDKL